MIKWLICILALGAVIQANVLRGGSSGQQIKPKLNCTEHGDGNFVYGCSKVFWQCANGILYSQHCHSELFFDPLTDACERQENIELCTNPNATNLHGPSKAMKAFSCQGKADGAYQLTPCLPRFVHCKSGHVFYEGCPTGTFYDDLKKYCDWPDKVVGCQDKERISSRSPPPAGSAAAPPGYGPQDVTPPSIIHQQSAYRGQFKLLSPPFVNSQQNDTVAYSFPQITPIDPHPAGLSPPVTKHQQPPQQPQQPQPPQQPQQPQPTQQPHQQEQQFPQRPQLPQQTQLPQQNNPQQPQPQSLPTSYRHEFDCAGKKDGVYPSPANACATFFYKCARNETHRYNCPHGLYFSTQKVHCEFPQKAPECNGHVLPYPTGPLSMNTNNSTKSNVQLSPSLSQQQPVTITVRPSFKVDFNCNDKADGFYTIGQCRNDYVRCVHKTAYLQECPENYVFDSDICEYMDECNKTVQLLTNGQQEVQTPVSQGRPAIVPASSSQTYTLKQAQQRAVTETQQAYNPSPQSKQIIQQNMPSQSSFLYNNTQHTSLQQQEPQGQNVAVKPELERAYGQSSRNPEGSQPQQNPPVPQAPKDTYCQDKGLVHGYHSPGCTNYFFACFSRETIRVQCPDNLFYDNESAICDYKANVPACGGIRPTSPSAQQQPQSYPTYVQQNVPAQQPPTVQEQSLQSYGQQQAQSSVQQTQPSYVQQPSQPQQPLFSSQHQQNDVQKSATLHSYVQNSGANQLQTQTEQPNIQNYVQQLPAIATFPSSNSYLYSEKQQQQVQQNQPIQQATQPPPHYQQQQQFNQLPQTASQSVHTYNNAQQQQATSQAQLQNSKTSYGHQSVQQSPPKIVETFCRDNNRHDGFNGAGCAPYFFVCALGETTRLHCPTGLYYDEESHECGLKTTITACGGHKPPAPSSAAQQQPLSQGSYGASSSSLPIQQQQPPAAPEFDCQQKQDGVYSTGCSSKYFICNQKKSKTLFCPPGTYYSASTELCDYRAHVTECGGIAPTTSRASQHPVLIPQKPYQHQPLHQIHEQPQPQQQQQPATSNYAFQSNFKMTNTLGQQAKKQPLGINYPPLQRQNPLAASTVSTTPTFIEDDKCMKLSNGIYGKKCTKFFFICIEKKAFDFICPKDQAFNLQTVKCAPKTEIQACPEYVSISQQPAVAMPQSQQSYNKQSPPPQPLAQQAPQHTYNPQPSQILQQQQQQQQPAAAAEVTPPPAWVPYSGQQQIRQPEPLTSIQQQQPANPAPAWVPYYGQQNQAQQNLPAQQPAITQSHYQQQQVQQQPQVHSPPQQQMSYNNQPSNQQQQPPAVASRTYSRSQDSYTAQQPQSNTPQQTAPQQSYQPVQQNNAPVTQQSY